MPTYCYKRRDNDESVAIAMSIKTMQRRQRKDGSIRLPDGALADRDYVAEAGSAETPDLWRRGLGSDAAGVNPVQAQDAMDEAKRRGVPTEFDRKTGAAKFRSRKHRRDYNRAFGYFDRQGGYSD